MKIKNRMILAMTLSVVLLAIPSYRIMAATGASFTITPTLTDAQSKKEGYFDLKATPGEQVKLTETITNITKDTKKLNVHLATAYTGDNGQVQYDLKAPTDDSASHTLTSLTSDPSRTIKLAGGQSKVVSFTVDVPEEGIKGEVIGSFYVNDTKSYSGRNTGVSVKNKFAMYTAVKLRTNDTYIGPNLKLRRVYVGTENNQASVKATIQNNQPQMFGKMTIYSKVYKGNSDKPIMTRTVSDYAMAPNSHFDFGTVTKHALVPGKYVLDLVAKSGSRTWHFHRHFKVTQKQANKVNKEASLKVDALNWWFILIIVLLVLFIIWLLILLAKRRKDD